MKTYDPNQFIEALMKRINNHSMPKCPYCGGNNFTTTDSIATILISKETQNVTLGPFIPSGMVICQKCGHIEFFALGPLEFITEEGENKDGQQKKK